MGLAPRWLEVARAIGVDAFLALWEILDRHDGDAVNLRVSIPRFTAYLRFQRNRFILAMASSGENMTSIGQALESQLGERLSRRQIARIINRSAH